LIELLVVIAIIAILAALLLPALRAAKMAALSTSCLNKTKQLLIAVNACADDHNETYPAYFSYGTDYLDEATGQVDNWQNHPYNGTWFIQLSPYLGSKLVPPGRSQDGDAWWMNWVEAEQEKRFLCALQSSKGLAGHWYAPDDPAEDWIAYNTWFGNAAGNNGHGYHAACHIITRKRVRRPASSAIFTDQSDANTLPYNAHATFYWHTFGWQTPAYLHHGKSANYGFSDGHAASMSQSQVLQIFVPDFDGNPITRTYFAIPVDY